MKKITKLLTIFSFFLILAACQQNHQVSQAIQEINIEQVDTLPENSIILFGKASCSACQKAKPILETVLKQENKTMYYLDFDKYTDDKYADKVSDILSTYNFSSVPTVVKIAGNHTAKETLKPSDLKQENITEVFKTFIK
ncbi:thioredoxin family protein [Carnobacteriaceae bacterium zg-ZUI78]|nr:thioredoxin family protein [Carnobacteriaceae bacterium zg-ZUI78]